MVYKFEFPDVKDIQLFGQIVASLPGTDAIDRFVRDYRYFQEPAVTVRTVTDPIPPSPKVKRKVMKKVVGDLKCPKATVANLSNNDLLTLSPELREHLKSIKQNSLVATPDGHVMAKAPLLFRHSQPSRLSQVDKYAYDYGSSLYGMTLEEMYESYNNHHKSDKRFIDYLINVRFGRLRNPRESLTQDIHRTAVNWVRTPWYQELPIEDSHDIFPIFNYFYPNSVLTVKEFKDEIYEKIGQPGGIWPFRKLRPVKPDLSLINPNQRKYVTSEYLPFRLSWAFNLETMLRGRVGATLQGLTDSSTTSEDRAFRVWLDTQDVRVVTVPAHATDQLQKFVLPKNAPKLEGEKEVCPYQQ